MTIAAILCGMSLIGVNAQTNQITDLQVEQIRNNCVSAKTTLNQLHSSDALLRVNMGQVYESISTKLMDKFNSRVSNNNYSNTDLVSIYKNYRLTLDRFRSDYIAYEEQLTQTIKIDCQDRPVAFYESVLLARTKRQQVNANTIKLNQYIDQYQSTVIKFENDYQTSIEKVEQ